MIAGLQRSLRAMSVAVLAVSLAPAPVDAGQAEKESPGNPARRPAAARTPWGHPDLQGTWDNHTITPRSWTAENLWTSSRGAIYEYACHEGNYGMVGILRGARAEEKR